MRRSPSYGRRSRVTESVIASLVVAVTDVRPMELMSLSSDEEVVTEPETVTGIEVWIPAMS